jgi:hypothetical protein
VAVVGVIVGFGGSCRRGRFRIVCEGSGRTQRFAFQAL